VPKQVPSGGTVVVVVTVVVGDPVVTVVVGAGVVAGGVVVVGEVSGRDASPHARVWHGKVAYAPVVPSAEGCPIGT
jgi:hypothetical protein